MAERGAPMGGLLSGAGVRALLVGSSRHQPQALVKDVPAAVTAMSELGETLVERAGLERGHLTCLQNPPDPGTFAQAVSRLAEQAEVVALLYYAGHGLLGPDGELYLATQASMDLSRGSALYQALPFSQVRELLSPTRAALSIVILDCCWAGRARGWTDSYLLTATSRDEQAWALPGEPLTAFTGALINVLTGGDPTGPRLLNLDDVHIATARLLREQGLPTPRRQAADASGRVPLLVNPAHRPPPDLPAPTPAAERGDQRSPYLGLHAYGVEDAPYFFGRVELTRALAERTRQSPDGLIVVTGPSGAGKSSLVQAGLIPALGDSRALLLTPGDRPVERLRRTLDDDGSNRVIVVDQFEEIFSHDIADEQREAFVTELIGLDRTVVIAVRADFFGHCTAYPALANALERPTVVGPLDQRQLREVIEQPARMAGLALEEGLVDLLLDDLGADRSVAVLPLLSHALLATWHYRQDGVLTLGAYRAAGGLSGALAKTADDTLARLGPESEAAARRILLRMIHLSEGIDDTRRRVPVSELQAVGDKRILDAFVTARMVTVGADTAEIAHEALLRHWPRLREWIDTDRAGLLIHQRLEDAALAWAGEDRHPSLLDRGPRLETATQWLEGTGREADLSPLVKEFYQSGVDHARAERRAERRRLRRGRQFMAALSALLVLALVLAGLTETARRESARQQNLAEAARQEAITQKDQAEAKNLGALAAELRQSDPMRAMRLSLAAWSISHGPEARSALIGSLAQLELSASPPPPGGTHASFSEDMKTRATITDNVVQIWDVASRRLKVGFPESVTASIDDAVPSPDGRTIAVRRSDSYGFLDTRTGVSRGSVKGHRLRFTPDSRYAIISGYQTDDSGYQIETLISMPNVTPVAGLPRSRRVTISPDGKLAALDREDGFIEVWRLRSVPVLLTRLGMAKNGASSKDADVVDIEFGRTGRELFVVTTERVLRLDMSQPSMALSAPAFSDTGEKDLPTLGVLSGNNAVLATANGYAVQLWDTATLRLLRTFSYPVFQPQIVAFQDGDRILAIGGSDGDVRTIDVEAITHLKTRLRPHEVLKAVQFSPDGKTLATMTEKAVRLWDLRGRHQIGKTLKGSWATDWSSRQPPDFLVPAMAFSPDGTMLAAARADARITLTDAASARVRSTIRLPFTQSNDYPPEVYSLAFSRDSGTLAIGTSEPAVRLWDVVRNRVVKTAKEVDATSLLWSPDGSELVIGSPSDVRRWRPEAEDFPGAAASHERSSEALALSPDGHSLAVRGENTCGCGGPVGPTSDTRVWIWDRTTMLPVPPSLSGHTGGAMAAAFSPDGGLLATAGTDATVRLWDVHNHRPVGVPLTWHGGPVLAVAFSADGKVLSSVDAYGGIHNTPIDPEQVRRLVCARSGGGLSRQEWDKFIPAVDYRPTC